MELVIKCQGGNRLPLQFLWVLWQFQDKVHSHHRLLNYHLRQTRSVFAVLLYLDTLTVITSTCITIQKVLPEGATGLVFFLGISDSCENCLHN